MWKPAPKPLSKMNRNELIRHLREFRDVWEKITTRNMDLSDDRLKETSVKGLRDLLSFYYSEDCRKLAEEWVSEEPQKRKHWRKLRQRKQRTLRGKKSRSQNKRLSQKRKYSRKKSRSQRRKRPNKKR